MTVKDRAENIHRLGNTAGHINGIVRRLEEDRFCMDVVRQIQATQVALAFVSESLLDEYLHTCMAVILPNEDRYERERILVELRFFSPLTKRNLGRLS